MGHAARNWSSRYRQKEQAARGGIDDCKLSAYAVLGDENRVKDGDGVRADSGHFQAYSLLLSPQNSDAHSTILWQSRGPLLGFCQGFAFLQ